jgi:hypothetical protein
MPYGIDAQHFEGCSQGWGRASLRFLVIAVPLLAAVLGLLGGGPASVTRAAGSGVALTIETPRVLRSGNWFESRIVVWPAVDIADLTIAVDQPLWRQMSIDTMAPDADKAQSRNGVFSYSFGPAKRGEPFMLKLDGQIQPRLLRRLDGRIAVRDGERVLVSAPVSVLVLP